MAKFDINDIKKYIENNRQQAILIGVGGVVVLLLLVFGVYKMVGGGSSPDELAAEPGTAGGGFAGAPTPTGGPPTPTMTPGGPAGGPPMPGAPTGAAAGPPMPSGSPAPEPSPAGSAAQSGAPAVPSADGSTAPAMTALGKKTKKQVAEPRWPARIDPFAPHGMKSAAEIKKLRARWLAQLKEDELRYRMSQLPGISIYRAKGAVAENPATQTPQTPETPVVRRTAGLLYGDRVLGVLETDGKTSVVKPGDVLTSGTERVKVTTIDRNGIVLKRLDSKKTGVSSTIRVPLKGAPEGGVTSPGGPRVGMPYGPSGMRGGPPMPGMPRTAGPPLPEG